MRILILIISFMLSLEALANSNYILVGISGFGTRRETEQFWQPSAAHDLLPSHQNIKQTHKLVHNATTRELLVILDQVVCDGPDHTPLIVTANSWGAGVAHKLMQMYHSRCKRPLDLLVLVDGVSKPLAPYGSLGKEPIAVNCVNIYQTKGLVRGGKIKNCENYDVTASCECNCSRAVFNMVSGADCHILTEWQGGRAAAEIIYNYVH